MNCGDEVDPDLLLKSSELKEAGQVGQPQERLRRTGFLKDLLVSSRHCLLSNFLGLASFYERKLSADCSVNTAPIEQLLLFLISMITV